MNNKDNYKKAIEKIHASDELKEKAFENARYISKSKKYTALKYLSTCAAALVLCLVGINVINIEKKSQEKNIAENKGKGEEILLANSDLPRFESMEQLKRVLEENTTKGDYGNYFSGDRVALESTITSAAADAAVDNSGNAGTVAGNSTSQKQDFSTTNTQVANVDEADIIKTDGDYIYCISEGMLYITKADTLELISHINLNTEKETFNIQEIFLKDDKVVLLGNGYFLEEPVMDTEENELEVFNSAIVNKVQKAKAIVYNIEDKNNPELVREVELEGNYLTARMVEDNLYFISRKNAYYYINEEDDRILPIIADSIATSEETKRVNCTDIVYFEGTEDRSFMLIGGFNINQKEEVYVETFFGAGEEVYANEENLYLTQSTWKSNYKTTIYKFALENAKITLKAKGEVDGYINDQFSMDEYDGNLRIATTSYKDIVVPKYDRYTVLSFDNQTVTTNNLYVLNENLEEIGKIEDLAEGEKIYSVRFVGKIGYIVTFKQIDPLFVIDLSDPTNPTVKGELKIPGYSSYLHPYDENHIIGIGYNTEDNGHGGISNSTMKMSMFDVSNLENPKEIFSVDIGENYASSEVISNHKALFYKKSENLIGFPINNNNYYNRNSGFVIFKIDLENNRFEKYGEILQNSYYKSVRRVIYIEDTLYTLGNSNIISYDLNSLEKLHELNFDNNSDYYNETVVYNSTPLEINILDEEN